MIQSAATKYAIRALCHLAGSRVEGRPVPAKEIAGRLEIPYHFLSKILQELARKGILESVKGPGGGFRLLRPPEETSLYDLVTMVEGPVSETECMLGLEFCEDEPPCPMHAFWERHRSLFRSKMESVSLVDLARTAEGRRETGAVVEMVE
ncbi:MAG: Rrf2 family transcriptional regulator [Thermoanaerobaculia bacterium]|nr:Rrf2 family transcriptional regulator [Thermoanaerobaculia bacterium]